MLEDEGSQATAAGDRLDTGDVPKKTEHRVRGIAPIKAEYEHIECLFSLS